MQVRVGKESTIDPLAPGVKGVVIHKLSTISTGNRTTVTPKGRVTVVRALWISSSSKKSLDNRPHLRLT